VTATNGTWTDRPVVVTRRGGFIGHHFVERLLGVAFVSERQAVAGARVLERALNWHAESSPSLSPAASPGVQGE
jgi:hypothetical protein